MPETAGGSAGDPARDVTQHRLLRGAIALATLAPRAAAFGYLLIAVVGVLRVRGDEVPGEASVTR
jgi:hypothetical protein